MEEKEMLENVEHCIKNFNGKMVDCIAVGNMYEKYVEQKSELEKYKKIAEKLAEILSDFDFDKMCENCRCDYCDAREDIDAYSNCIIEWARKEVENE